MARGRLGLAAETAKWEQFAGDRAGYLERGCPPDRGSQFPDRETLATRAHDHAPGRSWEWTVRERGMASA
jgi:hypothetical protein